ncbi:XRE family transcriptional regulator [Hydrogenophaga sp.]|uniref:XRE family transcriptional regulator n=1 Tax=Hydrogenophaga sp. TaxID=1904254 RepID=UPI0027311706|nr:XRE family transcriptional regulator [Hydrogenophaga sp.]MDP2015371.1 XRE family transcriptional regulator [Hydrogenophaga sp.]MDP3168559.1 XRE family transcriptional regulator [Hydrogenophaga sp.]
MHKVIHSESIKAALTARGWTQDQLADAIGESAQVVSNWMQGKNFPRPAKLLKLAITLKLGFNQLVKPDDGQPVIAFRKKAGAKTTDEHIVKAMAMGALLKPLVTHLPGRRALHTSLSVPSTEYSALQLAVAQVRERLAVGPYTVLKYEHLIQEFKLNDAVLVPVLWGEKQNHKNALHILLPSEQVTFVYLNLDTHLEDFKFWMAHELAHVYTPDLAGTNEGEDFADAFAGALLFPQACAEATYSKAAKASASATLDALLESANEHSISINTVYLQVQAYAAAKGLTLLSLDQRQLHSKRNSVRSSLVSDALFQPSPPKAGELIATTERLFHSHFFVALRQMLVEHGTGPGYLQQILDIGLQDATALHGALLGEQVH